MTMRRALWLGVLVVVTGHCGAVPKEPPEAQPNPAPTAAATAAKEAEDAAAQAAVQQVATEYLSAVNTGGLDGGIPYLHPDELARFKQLMIPVLEREHQAGRRTLLNATFGRRAEIVDVRLAEPGDFLRRFARVAAARLDQAPIRFDRVEPIGTIAEGEVMHVLAREMTSGGGVETGQLVVVSLRRSGSDWKVLLGGDVEALVISLQGRSGRAQPMERRAWPVPEAQPLPSASDSQPGVVGPSR